MQVKRTVKDSVFTKLFSIPKYCRELYLQLHPEDTSVKEEDIVQKTIQNVFTDGIYNDLGLLIKSRFLILVEAQSIWTVNILLRLLPYVAEMYKNYWESNKIYIYGTKKAKIPMPEFYVVYTGDKEIEKDVISLNEEFFDGKCEFLDLKVKVIRAKKDEKISDKLSTKDEKCDILFQYIQFSKIYDEKRRNIADKEVAIKETINECISKGYLKDFLIESKEEVMSTMEFLYNEDYIKECWEKEIRDEVTEKVTIDVTEKVTYKVRTEMKDEIRAEVKDEERADGKLLAYYDLYKNNQISVETIESNLNMSKEEFVKKVKELI